MVERDDLTIPVEVLTRHFDGQANAAVLAWIGDDPERQAAIDALSANWRAEADQLFAPYDANAAWRHVEPRLTLRTAAIQSKTMSRWLRPMAAAAALLLVAG